MRFGAVLLVVVLVSCGAAALAANGASPIATEGGQRARDCTTEAWLSRESPVLVRYIAWCGVQSGRVTLRIRRRDAGLSGFSTTARATGPGAQGPMRCRPLGRDRVFCEGRKSGPVTFRGTVTVPAGTRCSALLSLDVWRWTGDSVDFPGGCPRSYEPRERKIGQIISDREFEGLDLDLAGDKEAIARRAKSLLAAWRRGDPVARWTSEEEAFGMPLRAFEQAELEYRDIYRERFQDLVEDGDWVEKNAPDTYAGYEIDWEAGGIIYVGFTKEPVETLEKLKRRLIAPDRFRPFPITPTHTEAELERIWNNFPNPKSPLWDLVNSTGIHYIANKIEVGTQHVARVRRLIAEEYGPTAPFEVVFAYPAVLLLAS